MFIVRKIILLALCLIGLGLVALPFGLCWAGIKIEWQGMILICVTGASLTERMSVALKS
jgi:hypothetical protein